MPVTFAAPWALSLLAAVPVILWLHLRRRHVRQQRVPSLVPWLVLAHAEPARRRRPPRSIVLLLQVAAATCFALGLARPIGPGAAGTGAGEAVHRVVVVDTSTSMAAAGVWPAAIARADALVTESQGEVSLVTLGPRPRVLVARDAGGQAARAALADLQPGGSGSATDEALALAAATAPGAEIVLVTDGRITPPGPAAPPRRLELVGAPADNVAVVAAAPRTVAGQTSVFARVANLGAGAVTVPLIVTADGQPVDRRELVLPAGATHEGVWVMPSGARLAELRVVGQDALPRDDVAVVPLVEPPREVQLVGESPALARALGALPGVRLSRAGLGTYRADGSVDVTVFVGELPEALPPGGIVLFHPAAGGPLQADTERRRLLVEASGDHPLVAGLDLSGVELVDVARLHAAAGLEPALQAGDTPVAFAGRRDGRSMIVFPFDPDSGSLARRLAFPVLVARAVAAVAPDRPPVVVPAGAAASLPPGDGVTVLDPDGRRRTAGGTFDDTVQPGLYRVLTSSDRAEAEPAFAVLAGDPVESDLRAAGSPAQRSPPAGGASGRVAWWPWLIALGMACVLAEGGVRAWRGPAARPVRP